MSTAKHTQGPWYAGKPQPDRNGITEYVTIGTFEADNHYEDSIAHVVGGEHDEAINAKLISAAPELLEATKQYVSTPQTCACLPDSDCAEAVARQRARAAIAKAEGV